MCIDEVLLLLIRFLALLYVDNFVVVDKVVVDEVVVVDKFCM